jgi:hypothetical protein
MLMQIANRKYQYFEIDDSDFELVSKYIWGIDNGYPYSSIKGNRVRLHRMLLGLVTGDGNLVDHKDGNPLNNRRDNIRVCTRSQNNRNARKKSRNTSGLKGVTRHRNKWLAQIYSGSKHIILGQYSDKIEAAKAYDKAADNYHGEFASLNFDESSEHYYKKDTISSFNFYETKKRNKTSSLNFPEGVS